MRIFVVACLFTLAACGSCGNEWPLSVQIAGQYEVSEALGFPGTPREELRSLSLPAGEYGAAEMLFRIQDDEPLVWVNLAEPRWVRMASPVSPDYTQFLRGLGVSVHASFFEDGDRAIVLVDGTTKAVQCSTERVRVLDHGTSMLESCRMTGGRQRYECHLDMMWSSAEFDADGEDLSGNFTPAWR